MTRLARGSKRHWGGPAAPPPAHSRRLHPRIGWLAVGEYAELAAFDVADYPAIPYHFGVCLCGPTTQRGVVICTEKM
ncbi:MAG: hypothetical protein ABSA57_02515 [Candidatus Acidiferrales bacterium]